MEGEDPYQLSWWGAASPDPSAVLDWFREPAPPAPMPLGGQLPLGELPDAVLSAIISCLSRYQARPLALVSKRFHRLVWEQPSLWRSVRLDAPEPTPLAELLRSLRTCWDEEWEQMLSHQRKWVARQVLLLSRVAHLVQRFALTSCDHLAAAAHAAPDAAGPHHEGASHTRLAALLSALPPSTQLRHVQLAAADTSQPPPAALTNWLRSHSGLTALSLSVGLANSALRAAVCPRPQLLQLHLAAPELPPELLSALVSGLPQLTELKLRSTQRPFPPQTSQLSQLGRLQQLTLQPYGPQGDSPASLPAPEALPALLEYDYRTNRFASRIQVAGTVMASADFRGGLLGLCTAHIARGTIPPLLPGRAAPLHSLVLIDCKLELSMASAAQPLAAVNSMSLHGCTGEPSLAAVLPALLAAMPNLAYLGMGSSHTAAAGGITAQDLCGIAHATTLTHLSLADNQALTSLPEGLYLQGLRELNLSRGALSRVPDAVAHASRLSALDLSANPNLYLDDAGVDTLLCLPQLRQLRLYETCASLPALRRLARAFTHLNLAEQLGIDLSAEEAGDVQLQGEGDLLEAVSFSESWFDPVGIEEETRPLW